jgi:hypothetical protein
MRKATMTILRLSDKFGTARRAAAAGMALCALAGLASCENSDPVAPPDSTITVSANPQTVITPGGQAGTADITAIVRSKNGTRLPDQEVTFDSSVGSLDPIAGTTITTDDDGVAACTLTTTGAATVTARSGSISGTTQVQTASADLTTFTLDVLPDLDLNSCTKNFFLTATVLDVDGNPVPGILVFFEQNNVPQAFAGNFTPASGQVRSDNSGEARAQWQGGSGCATSCVGAICEVEFTATDISNALTSNPVVLTDSVQ